MNDFPPGFSPPGTATPPFTITQVVEWGSMDSLGHVNNAVYLRWFENVRFHYFDLVGLNACYEGERIGPILAQTTVEFLAPVQFPDELLLATRVVEIGTTSFTMDNAVWSQAQRRLVARGPALIVVMDYARNHKTPIPEPVRAAIIALDQPKTKPPRLARPKV